MISLGQYYVYLTGSHKRIIMAIYKDENGKLFCKLHGTIERY